MAYTKVCDGEKLDAELSNVANAVRDKNPNANQMDFYAGDFAKEIRAIPQEGSVIDSTLTQAGQAADAKAVGDKLGELNRTTVYIGPDRPTTGVMYWLDTSDGSAPLPKPEPVLHSITNMLAHCKTSNTAKSIADGAKYEANITADSGYTMDGASVSVTMGGQILTAYSSGAITIPSVTGDVVVTATAVKAADPEPPAADTWSITTSLTNCTISNPATTVKMGEAYNATLTADEGFSLGVTSITMGGKNITGSVYKDGVITIPIVTGDVVVQSASDKIQENRQLLKNIASTVTDRDDGKYRTYTIPIVRKGDKIVTACITDADNNYAWIAENGSFIFANRDKWFQTIDYHNYGWYEKQCISDSTYKNVKISVDIACITDRGFEPYIIRAPIPEVADYKLISRFNESWAPVTFQDGLDTKAGETYTNTLIPGGGKKLGKIVVTMNGVDITAEALVGNQLTVQNVTGNILIYGSLLNENEYFLKDVASEVVDGSDSNDVHLDMRRFTIDEIHTGDVIRLCNISASSTGNAKAWESGDGTSTHGFKDDSWFGVTGQDGYKWYQYTCAADKEYKNIMLYSRKSIIDANIWAEPTIERAAK